jgi:hypothetical protein
MYALSVVASIGEVEGPWTVLPGTQLCTPGGNTTSESPLGNETGLHVALEKFYPSKLSSDAHWNSRFSVENSWGVCYLVSRICSTFRMAAMEFKEACSEFCSRWLMKVKLLENIWHLLPLNFFNLYRYAISNYLSVIMQTTDLFYSYFQLIYYSIRQSYISFIFGILFCYGIKVRGGRLQNNFSSVEAG